MSTALRTLRSQRSLLHLGLCWHKLPSRYLHSSVVRMAAKQVVQEDLSGKTYLVTGMPVHAIWTVRVSDHYSPAIDKLLSAHGMSDTLLKQVLQAQLRPTSL